MTNRTKSPCFWKIAAAFPTNEMGQNVALFATEVRSVGSGGGAPMQLRFSADWEGAIRESLAELPFRPD